MVNLTTKWALPLFVDTDVFDPIQTPLGLMSTATEAALDSAYVKGLPKVANQAARDLLYPPASVRQGDGVFRIDLGVEERYFAVFNAATNTSGMVAAGWVNVATPRIGYVDRGATPSDVIVTANAVWQDVPEMVLTVITTGRTVEVDYEAVAKNAAGVSAYYEIVYRVTVDGVAVGGERTFSMQGVAGVNPTAQVRGRFRHNPTAGSHVWKLQHYCGAATVVGTKFASMKIAEQ